METNDIFEPNHLDSNNKIVESYYDQDSDCSQTPSSSNSSQSSNASQASTQSLKKVIPWIEVQTFTDLSLADQYVEQMTSTRDSSKPVCIFFDKFTILKHNMLQQVRHCKSKSCKLSLVACDFRIKYQKCVPCGKAVVYEAYEHPVVESQADTRGICDNVKKVINDCLQKSVRTVRPCDLFVYLNQVETKNNEMKDLPQPTLAQLRYYLRNYRELTIGTGTVTTEDIKNKIKENMFHTNIKEEQGFYFGYDLDSNGEPIVESTK
jgi:hypothetical protein